LRINRESGQIESIEEGSLSSFLDKIIDKFEKKDNNTDFSIQRDAFVKLKSLNDNRDLVIALTKISLFI
jgi:hypothetical protein